MTREEAVKELKQLEERPGRDIEGDHVRADEILVALLIDLGYDDVVAAWEKVGKWYA